MEWADGTRVRVAPHHFWPDGMTGTIRPFPAEAAEICGGAEGCSRVTQGRLGPLTIVWVVFDEAAQDGNGDGPYREGEILSEYLSPVERQPNRALQRTAGA